MVASRFDVLGQAFEEAFAVVHDIARLAMDDLARCVYISAVRSVHAL